MNRERAASVFQAYTSRYDAGDIKIAAKIDHTHRVAANADRIAESLGMGAEDGDFAWFLGLLHDIGRFEQVRRFGTFIDGDSVDHAELGADILFLDRLIDAFPTGGLPSDWRGLCETAIRLHNKLTLPEGQDERARTFCQIIRDADKIDIFRVVSEIPFRQRIGASAGRYAEADEASPAVMACVRGHRCVPREVRRSVIDGHISHCCMAFELVYDESRRLVREQGFLRALFRETDNEGRPKWPEKALSQLRELRHELERAWGMTLWEE